MIVLYIKHLAPTIDIQEIGLLWSSESYEKSTISDLECPPNFQVKEKEIIEIGQ